MTSDRYGGHALRRNDDDSTRLWGGTGPHETDVPIDVAPSTAAGSTAMVAPAPVRRLQEDLWELGFCVVPHPATGKFDRNTEWAVREFQAYAKMEQVAQQEATALHVEPNSVSPQYMLYLSGAANPSKYDGPVSGVVNQKTRERLALWLRERLRCPVVVEAWKLKGGVRLALLAENFWAGEMTDTKPRVYSFDFSDHYTPPAPPPGLSQKSMNALHALGDYATSDYGNGPRIVGPAHTWTESEVTPEALSGKGFGELGYQDQVFFKCIRAVSEVECDGYFEGQNDYDTGIISVGVFHWTLSSTGLPKLLRRFMQHDPAAFEHAFGTFGLSIVKEEPDPPSGPNRSHDRFGLQNEAGGHDRADKEGEREYFRTWHWVYRFAMACRTVSSFQQAMWEYAKTRFDDFRRIRWHHTFGPTSSPTTPTIGEVYTSEMVMAILLRWHVNLPSTVIGSRKEDKKRIRQPGRHLRNAFESAKAAAPSLNWTAAPATWSTDHEKALIEGLRTEAQSSSMVATIRDTTPHIVEFGDLEWASVKAKMKYRLEVSSPLSRLRGSFSHRPKDSSSWGSP